MSNNVEVLVWPDGSWMYADDHEDVVDAWRGDDYFTMSVPDTLDEEGIELLCMTSVTWPVKYCVPLPNVGDTIYVGGSMYLSHGADDFAGGRATVSKVEQGISGGALTHYVSIKERPGTAYNWKYLAGKQDALKNQFGDDVAHPDPDHRKQFNESPGEWGRP